MTMIQCIYRAARENGHRVVLDGMSGDVVLAEGSYIVRLIRSGRIGTAMKEIIAENRFWGDKTHVRRLIRYGRAALLPEGIRKKLTKFRRDSRVEEAVSASLISAGLADRVNIAGRIRLMQQNLAREWRADYAVERCEIIRPSVTAGRERYSRAAAAFGAEARDPFLDKRVVDYCLSLPGRLLLRDGWPKFTLREAMAGELPDEVRWQRGKPHLGWLFNRAVTKSAIDRGEISLDHLQKYLQDYVDPHALRSAWEDIVSGGDGGHAHSAHVLTAWLRENAGRPRIED
jgi:asparagine synthase (glutamine-hydrolysing)